jgi:G patch domain-containing protein 1
MATCMITVQCFGVKDPDLEVPVDTFGPSAGLWGPNSQAALADKFVGASTGITQVESGSRSSKRNLANIGIGEDDEQRDDV